MEGPLLKDLGLEVVSSINTDSMPMMPDTAEDWYIWRHGSLGTFELSECTVRLWYSIPQIARSLCDGYVVCQEIADKFPLNASVADHLFAFPYLLPEALRPPEGGVICFWGTIFCRHKNRGIPYIRCLYEKNGRLTRGWIALSSRFTKDMPALVFAPLE